MAGIKRPAYDDQLAESYTPSKRQRQRQSLGPQSSSSSGRASASATALGRESRLHQNSRSILSSAWNFFGIADLLRKAALLPTTQALPPVQRSPVKSLLEGFKSSNMRRLSHSQPTQTGGGGVISRLKDYQAHPDSQASFPAHRTSRGGGSGAVIDLTAEEEEEEVAGSGSNFNPGQYNANTESQNGDIQYAGTSRATKYGQPMALSTRRQERQRRWATGSDDTEGQEHERQASNRTRDYERDKNAKARMRVLEAQLAEARYSLETGHSEQEREQAKKVVKSTTRCIEDEKKRLAAQEVKPNISTTNSGPESFNQYKQLLQERWTSRKRDILEPKPTPQAPALRESKPIPSRYKQAQDISELLTRLEIENEEQEARFKPKVPATLPPDELQLVKQTLGNPRFKTPKNGNEVIESKNIPRLKDAQWLSDDIMAYYVQLIGARNAADPKLPTLHCFNTFFYTKIEKDPTSHASVRRWTKKVDIFSKDMVLIPINVGNMHWVAAVINFKQKRIEYFDSMGVSQHASREIFDTLSEYLVAEHQDKKGSPFDLSDWECSYLKDAPRQNNGYDCGVFSCQTLELVARGVDPIERGFEFSSANMSFFRKLMVYEITKGELKKRW